MIIIKSPEEIEAMRRAGRVVALAHQRLAAEIRPGIRTKELDAIVLEVLKEQGATSPPSKDIKGFRRIYAFRSMRKSYTGSRAT